MSSTFAHGAYQKVKDIGEGAYGKCILAQNKRNELVVIKTIDLTRLPQTAKEDTMEEVKVHSRAKNYNVVEYKDSYIENGKLNIIMEYGDMGDLFVKTKQHYECKDPYTEEQLKSWLCQSLLALKGLHSQCIIHRDIKTANFYLQQKNDRLILGDFGVARILQNKKALLKESVGTVLYSSPEILIENAYYSFATDIWSLGSMFYELALLKHPFSDCSTKEATEKILKNSFPELPKIYSRDFHRVIKLMITKDWRSRPSAEELLEDPYIIDNVNKIEKLIIDWRLQKGRVSENTALQNISIFDVVDKKYTDTSSITSKNTSQIGALNSFQDYNPNSSFQSSANTSSYFPDVIINSPNDKFKIQNLSDLNLMSSGLPIPPNSLAASSISPSVSKINPSKIQEELKLEISKQESYIPSLLESSNISSMAKIDELKSSNNHLSPHRQTSVSPKIFRHSAASNLKASQTSDDKNNLISNSSLRLLDRSRPNLPKRKN